jgi:hypothetical protein
MNAIDWMTIFQDCMMPDYLPVLEVVCLASIVGDNKYMTMLFVCPFLGVEMCKSIPYVLSFKTQASQPRPKTASQNRQAALA